MKKLFTIVCTLVLGGALTFAQTGASAGGQNPPAGDKTGTTTASKKGTKGGKKGHKGGKKSKKSSQTTATPAPK
jgi:Spy/CpxP family protein refolding chaperone